TAVQADYLHAEQHHAGRLPARRPAIGVVKELPAEEGDHYPQIGAAPVDGGAGQHAGGERGCRQNEHEHPDAQDAVEQERDETRGEPGVLAPQVSPGPERRCWWRPAIARHQLGQVGVDRRGHGSSSAFGNSGGPDRLVWLRRSLLAQRARVSSILTAWPRPMSMTSVARLLEELTMMAPRSVFLTSASTSTRLTIWLMSTWARSLSISSRSSTWLRSTLSSTWLRSSRSIKLFRSICASTSFRSILAISASMSSASITRSITRSATACAI